MTTFMKSHDHIYEVIDRNYDVITFILRRPTVAGFAGIIKIVTMFIKKGSKKVKKIRNCMSGCNLYLYFLM